MCGICGIARADGAPVTSESLEKMNMAIVHRGPDGEGLYSAPGIGLAMRRLAVIDLHTGDQPITNEDHSIWIVFNGEVYNFPDLRRELETRGHVLTTHTDTECVVHLYEDYGVECLQHLRGMFAFALWDAVKQRLFIARDRLGKKPLFYTVQGGTLTFASELSALLTALPQKPAIDMQAVDDYLSLQFIPEPHTIYQDIAIIPPAHFLIWQAGNLRVERYWQLQYLPKHTASDVELKDELHARVCEAVRLRLASDVPLGVHLSGGIDSSIVVAAMAKAGISPLKTFTIDFQESEFSEVAYARMVAQRYTTEHHEFTLNHADIPATLETILRHVGEPLADPSLLPSFHLARLTREHVTVALNGDGGDESLGGYQRYWLDPWANCYHRLPGIITRRWVPSLARHLPEHHDRPAGRDLVSGLKRLDQVATTDPRASLLRWGSYFSAPLKQRLWRNEFRTLDTAAAEKMLVQAHVSARADSFLDRTLAADITTYLPGDLLVKADRMTMAHSLEGRSPFLDHIYMEWAARLPDDLKVRGGTGKYLLRKAFHDDLPEPVQRRGKQGFGVPVGTWLRGPLAAWAESLVRDQLSAWFEPVILGELFTEHHAQRANHGKRLWALTVLAAWKDMAGR